MHPISLGCVVTLAVNDHLLKGAGVLPGWFTGKLSDFAGLAFFPLLCTVLFDLGLMVPARLGARIDFSLRRWKLWIAIAATAVFFAAIKLEPRAAEMVAGWLSVVGWTSTIVADPTDLVALVALVVPLWIGYAELRRMPLGRLEVLERLELEDGDELQAALEDVANPPMRARLAAAIARFRQLKEPEDLQKVLDEIRFGVKQASRGGFD